MGLFDKLRGKKKDPSAELREACTGAAEEDEPVAIALGVLFTRDLPGAGRSALDGFTANARKHGRRLDLLVIDDGAGGTLEGVRVLDRAARAAWAERLAAASGVDVDLVRFALLGELPGSDWATTGAARNAGMLAAAGRAALLLGDASDHRPHPTTPEAPDDGLELSSLTDPSELWFHPTVAAALDRPAADIDLVAAHERMLGLMAATVIEALPEDAPLEIGDARPALVTLASSGHARVRATMLGLHGDCAMGNPLYYLLLRGPSRERLVADHAVHRLTRGIARGVTRATMAPGRWLMAANLALDLREPLPPFPPAGANCDGLFAAALRGTHPIDLIGYLPWTVAHRPADARPFTDDDLFDPLVHLPPAHQVMLWTATYQGELDAEPADRQAQLGADLCTAGRLEPEAYRDQMREMAEADANARAHHLTDSLDQYDDEPADWAADLQRAIELAGREPPEPEQPERVQQLLVRWGELLQAWPQIAAAAVDTAP